MLKLLARIANGIGNASTLWGLLPTSAQTVVTAIASAVTGYFTYQSSGIAVAIIAASAVFAFSMFGTLCWIGVTRLTSVYERLTVENVGMATGFIFFDKDQRNNQVHVLRNFTLQLTLRNHSPQQTIYFVLKRVQHSIGNASISGVPVVSSVINIIPPGSFQNVTLQTLPDIPLVNELTGYIDMELMYGDNKDKLEYLLIYKSKPQIGAIIGKKKGLNNSQITINAAILQHLHVRVPRHEQKQLPAPAV